MGCIASYPLGCLTIQQLHDCRLHFPSALLITMLNKPLQVELFSSYFSALASPVVLVFYPFGIAPQGGFSPLHYRQAQNRVIGNFALFPSRPYSFFVLGSSPQFQGPAPSSSGQACFHAPRRTRISYVSGWRPDIGGYTGDV